MSLIGLAFAIQSWVDAAKQIHGGYRWAGGVVQRGGTALMGMPGARAAVALLTTLLVPAAQLLTLGLCYLGGNYMSMGFGDDARAEAALKLLRHDPWVVLHPHQATQVLTLDWWSGGCVVLAAVFLIRSYKLAAAGRNDELFKAGAFVAGPITLVLLVAVCGLILLPRSRARCSSLPTCGDASAAGLITITIAAQPSTWSRMTCSHRSP